MKKIFISILILLLSINLLSAKIIHMEIEDLIYNSHEIIEGEVVKISSEWGENHRLIYTLVKINVTKAYYGSINESQIIIKDVGGNLGDYFTSQDEQAEYIIGDHVLLLLQPEDKHYRTYGLNQGYFIIDDSDNKKKLKRKINPNNLMVLDKNKSHSDIKSNFDYDKFIEKILKSKSRKKGEAK